MVTSTIGTVCIKSSGEPSNRQKETSEMQYNCHIRRTMLIGRKMAKTKTTTTKTTAAATNIYLFVCILFYAFKLMLEPKAKEWDENSPELENFRHNMDIFDIFFLFICCFTVSFVCLYLLFHSLCFFPLSRSVFMIKSE